MNNFSPEVTGHYAVVENTRVFFDKCGDNGPVLVCLHPAGTNSMQFYSFIQEISKYGFRAIAVDLPGHGKSYPKNWEPIRSISEYATFMLNFIHEVLPDEKPIMCGAAIGGAIALEMATKYSDDILGAIAMETMAAPEGPQFSSNCKWWEHPHSMPGWRDLAERVAISGTFGLEGDKLREFRWQHRYCAQEVSTADLTCWATHDVRAYLGQINCPVLMVKGESDYWVPESSIDDLISKAPEGMVEKLIAPGMGHYPMVEAPAELAKQLQDFLERRIRQSR